MKLAVMQPYFLPYLGAYQHVAAVDKYIIYGKFYYRNDGWFHRNRLLEKNKGPRYFNVQLLHGSFHKTFSEIEVDPSPRWRNKLLKSIEQNYGKCEYFHETIEVVRNIILAEYSSLLDYNSNTMISISKHLDIPTEIAVETSRYNELERSLELEYPADEPVKPETENYLDKKTARVLGICKEEQAGVFVNAIGGKALYSKQEFAHHGIELQFVQTKEIEYKQQIDRFEPNLSILDVLMNCGRDMTKELLLQYELV